MGNQNTIRTKFNFIDGSRWLPYRASALNMNIRLILRTLFVIGILSTLVLLGMANQQPVELWPPHFWPSKDHLRLPAALMYFSFFGVGFLAGTLMMAGGKKGKK